MEKLLGLPVLASEHGKDVDNLIIYVHWLMIVLFVGWLAYFAYALFRFHRSRNPKADYVGVKNHASNYIEVAGGHGRYRSIPFRYVWPAELDLMAQLAGLRLRERWEGWAREPFTSGERRARLDLGETPCLSIRSMSGGVMWTRWDTSITPCS